MADLDGDVDLDLAVANLTDRTVAVLQPGELLVHVYLAARCVQDQKLGVGQLDASFDIDRTELVEQ